MAGEHFAQLRANAGSNPGLDRGMARLNALKRTLAVDLLRALPDRDPWQTPTVGVIGAGFAGLAAAYFLRGLGFRVEVFEASDRVGGRVWSAPAPALPDRTVEYGAELIGYNHALWLGFSPVFDLGFTMLTGEDQYIRGGLHPPVDLNGEVVAGADADAIWTEMDEAFETLDDLALDIVDDPYRPWQANAEPYDRKSLKEWKEGLHLRPQVDRAVDVVLSCNNTLALSEQSFLGALTQVSGGGGSAYWTDSEVMRCTGGNMLLATRMRKALEDQGRTHVRTSSPVGRVALENGRVALYLAGSKVPETFDYVVLSVPPTAWQRIEFSHPLGDDVKMSTGLAVKLISPCRRRFWEPEGRAPIGLSDLAGETWEATDGTVFDRDQPVVLSLFAGATQAEEAIKQPDEATRLEWYASRLSRLFPGYRNNLVDRPYFVNWPGHEWIRCGYSFPRPGLVTTVARALSQPYAPFERRLVFAGEHTCPAFYGYMEGALESGLMAAGQIAEAVGGILPEDNVHDALYAASVAGRAPDEG